MRLVVDVGADAGTHVVGQAGQRRPARPAVRSGTVLALAVQSAQSARYGRPRSFRCTAHNDRQGPGSQGDVSTPKHPVTGGSALDGHGEVTAESFTTWPGRRQSVEATQRVEPVAASETLAGGQDHRKDVTPVVTEALCGSSQRTGRRRTNPGLASLAGRLGSGLPTATLGGWRGLHRGIPPSPEAAMRGALGAADGPYHQRDLQGQAQPQGGAPRRAGRAGV